MAAVFFGVMYPEGKVEEERREAWKGVFWESQYEAKYGHAGSGSAYDNNHISGAADNALGTVLSLQMCPLI